MTTQVEVQEEIHHTTAPLPRYQGTYAMLNMLGNTKFYECTGYCIIISKTACFFVRLLWGQYSAAVPEK